MALAGCQSNGANHTPSQQGPIEALEAVQKQEAKAPAGPPEMQAGGAFVIGAYLEFAGDGPGAAAQYQRAAALDTDEYLATKQMLAEFALGKIDAAFVQRAEKLILLYPHSVALHLLWSEVLEAQGKEEAAIRAYEKLLKVAPLSREAYKQLITLHQKRKDNKKALALALQFSHAVPDSELAWLTLTQLYLAAEQPEPAIKALEKVYHLQPQQLDTAIFYAYLLDRYGHALAFKQVIQSLYAEEIPIEGFGSRTLAFFKMYRNLDFILQRINGLLAPSEKGYVELQLQQVFLQWEKGDLAKALALLQTLAPSYESDRIQFLLGLGYQKMGQLPAAETAYQQVEKQTKYYLVAQQQWIQVCIQQKKMAQATTLAEALLQYPYAGWDLYPYAASVYATYKQYDRALSLLAAGYRKYPTKTDLLFLQGVYEEQNGHLKASLSHMEAVIQADPLESRAWNFIGYSLAEQGENLERAEEYVRRALEIKPGDGYYLDSLGWIYYKRKDFPRALEYLQAAVQTVPQEGIMYEHLGDIYQALQQPREAIKAYQQANAFLTEENEKSRILQKIQSLTPSVGHM